MSEKGWMIYGVYGYTGRLLAEEAKSRGLAPVLAGRNKEKTDQVAQELGFPCCSFSLEDTAAVAKKLKDIHVVVNCAGPFVATVEPMVEACLESGTHYVDITGEIDVLEYTLSRTNDAREKNIALCSGAGFDVVPTDCIAAVLKEAMPDATHLALAYYTRSKLSPGTSKTSAKMMFSGGRVRRDGEITRVSLTHKVREIRVDKEPITMVTIPWGDVSTAYHSTGIPNVEVYFPTSAKATKKIKVVDSLRFLWAYSFVERYLLKKIEKTVAGPTLEEREETGMAVWGEVRNSRDEIKEARVTTANGYDVTVQGAMGVTAKLLEDQVAGGAYTPSRLMGSNYICALPGSSNIEIT